MTDLPRRSLIAAARRGATANKPTKQAPPPSKPAPAPVAAAPQPAKPAEVVKASCGHDVEVGPCKPVFLAGRLKQLAGLPCPDCKRKAHQEREAAEQEAARERREEKASEPRREKPRAHIARLPHGANFNVTWDAEALKWSGTLTIPAPGSGIFRESVVSADDGAVFALLQRLDRKFRGVEEGPAATDAAPAPSPPV